MMYRFLIRTPGVSRLLVPVEDALQRRDEKLLSKGFAIDMRKTPPVTAGRSWLLAAVALGLAVLAFNVANAAGKAVVTLPLLLPAALLLALSLWLLLVALCFGSWLCPCGDWKRRLYAFLNGQGFYREEPIMEGSSKTARVSGMRLWVFSEGDFLCIRAIRDPEWYSQAESLDACGLDAVVGRKLEEKREEVGYWEYRYRIREDARIQAVPRLLSAEPSGAADSIPLTGSLSWRFAKLPHMLIAGGTGGGKSTFIYYLIAEFLRLGDGSGGAGEVYVCDPKNAELASLSHVFGADRVGVTPAQIAKVVRLCREEMDRRYAYMQEPERFRFGADAFSYGLNPVFLVFDEVAAFKAAADKKTYEEVWDNLTQLVLKARAANVFVILALQQPRAESISTDIRDNLGARVSLGTLSSEGYRMAFGCSVDAKPIAERGTGYIMLDGWNAPKPFKAPFADYSRVEYPKELKRLYRAAQSRNGHPLETSEGASAGDSPNISQEGKAVTP